MTLNSHENFQPDYRKYTIKAKRPFTVVPLSLNRKQNLTAQNLCQIKHIFFSLRCMCTELHVACADVEKFDIRKNVL